MIGGSLWVLQLLPSLKLVTMILLKVALNTKNQSINLENYWSSWKTRINRSSIFVGIKY
jgi:hypothetical protein